MLFFIYARQSIFVVSTAEIGGLDVSFYIGVGPTPQQRGSPIDIGGIYIIVVFLRKIYYA